MIPIQSLDIEGESQISFDLYVNLPLNNRYVLYRKKGSSVESEKMEKFANLNVKNFFVRKEEYGEFVKYVSGRMKDLIQKENTPDTRKLMLESAKALLGGTFQQDDIAIFQAMMENLRTVSQAIIESVLESSNIGSKNLFLRLVELAQTGTTFQRHPVNVASFCVLITYGIGYSNEKTLSDVAMAGLLHDVGLSRLPTRIINEAHAPGKLSAEDRAQLYKHPEYSIEVLKERNIKVTPMMEMMILQHHEQFGGGGYPRGLRGFLLSEIAQVLHFCDLLDEVIVQNSVTAIGMRVRIYGLLDALHHERIIDPNLLARIRQVIL